MPSAPRVLIALRPRMYAEALAFSVGRDRPCAEVSVLDPSEDLEEAAVRLRPHLVVANRVPKATGEEGHFFWVEVDEPHADEGIKKHLGAVVAPSWPRSADDAEPEVGHAGGREQLGPFQLGVPRFATLEQADAVAEQPARRTL